MNIEFNQSNDIFERQQGWHILTVAEAGFSMLTGYAEQFGIDGTIIRRFEEAINRDNQSGSLYPKAPISALPCKYFRELANSHDTVVLAEFKKEIIDFLSANSKTIKSRNIVIDFRVCHDPVTQHFIDITLDLIDKYGYKSLENICILGAENRETSH